MTDSCRKWPRILLRDGGQVASVDNLGQSIHREVDLTFSTSIKDALETELFAIPCWPRAWGETAFRLWSLREKRAQIHSVGVQEHRPGDTLPGLQSLFSESRTWSPQASAVCLRPSHSWWRLTLGSPDLLGAVQGLCVGFLPVLPC